MMWRFNKEEEINELTKAPIQTRIQRRAALAGVIEVEALHQLVQVTEII
jgi:hypothetical protein